MWRKNACTSLPRILASSSKTVLDKLKDMGEFVKSASSTVEAPVARKLKNAFQKGEAKPGASAAERKTPAPAPSEHRAPAVKPAPVAKPGLGKKPAAAPRPAEPRSAAPAAHVPSSNRGTTPRDNRNESRGDMRDARPNREGGERPVPHPRSVTIRTRPQGSAAPSPARVPTNPVTAATPAAVPPGSPRRLPSGSAAPGPAAGRRQRTFRQRRRPSVDSGTSSRQQPVQPQAGHARAHPRATSRVPHPMARPTVNGNHNDNRGGRSGGRPGAASGRSRRIPWRSSRSGSAGRQAGAVGA